MDTNISAKGGSQPKADQPLADAKNSGGKIIGFYLIGLILSLDTEMIRFVLIEKREADWISMTIAYIVILTIALVLTKIIKNNLLYYIIFGIFGLALEIFWFGQAPNIMTVGLLGWIMWFSYWGSIVLIPKLYLENRIDKVFLTYFFASLALFTFIFLIPKNTGATGLFFTSLNIIYLKYFFKR